MHIYMHIYSSHTPTQSKLKHTQGVRAAGGLPALHPQPAVHERAHGADTGADHAERDLEKKTI